MTIQQLTEIIRIADKKAITKQLKELGYVDCKKDKELRHLSLVNLFEGELEETDTFSDDKNKFTYEGAILTQVKGYEQLEFVIVNINNSKKVFPVDLLIWTQKKRYIK